MLSLAALIMASCSPPPALVKQTAETSKPKITSAHGDTVSFAIEFPDDRGRKEFLRSFREFLSKYPFTAVTRDSIQRIVYIRLLPPPEAKTDSLIAQESARFIEEIIEETIQSSIPDSAAEYIDSIVPATGGVARLYLSRSGVDPSFSSLMSVFPFANENSQGFMTIIDSSRNKITLRLNGRTLNGKNKVISALDVIELWSDFIRNHPSEGKAIFYNVEGVREFIEGKEAVVKGFGATDERTMTLRLSQGDSCAIGRLSTSRLFGPELRLGSYYIDSEDKNNLILLPNVISTPGRTAFLDKLVLHRGGDPNPILSFSLNKYDAVVLTSLSDLDYARGNLSGKASVVKIPSDRYFLACSKKSSNLASVLRKQVDRADLLQNFVKAEGNLISAIETDSVIVDFTEESDPEIPGSEQQRILFRKDDPVSKIIAERILACLSRVKINCSLIAADPLEYERVLVSKEYECAVGWVSEEVKTSRSEQLRLAAIWFEGQNDERVRLEQKREIPLFTINKYLLARNGIGLHRGHINGIYADPQFRAP